MRRCRSRSATGRRHREKRARRRRGLAPPDAGDLPAAAIGAGAAEPGEHPDPVADRMTEFAHHETEHNRAHTKPGTIGGAGGGEFPDRQAPGGERATEPCRLASRAYERSRASKNSTARRRGRRRCNISRGCPIGCCTLPARRSELQRRDGRTTPMCLGPRLSTTWGRRPGLAVELGRSRVGVNSVASGAGGGRPPGPDGRRGVVR